MNLANLEKQPVSPFFELWEDKGSGYKSMYATKDLEAFTFLSTFGSQEIFNQPTRYTIQTGENRHIVFHPKYLQYINHSCAPNVFFDTTKMILSTLQPIKCGEEVAFFYPSTEWKMIEDFDCSCQSEQCLQRVKGAAHLTVAQFEQHKLSDFITKRYKELLAV